MRELAGVTLICVDTLNHALALRALALSRAALQFAETLFLTHAMPGGLHVPSGVSVREIAKLGSRDDYSRFILKSLLAHVTTPHVLLIQWDGYVINPDSFDPAFLDCDYIGAKWFWFDDGMRVGNGGFSLRSRRLLQALQDPRIDLVEAEDVTIGRAFRPLLEGDHGIRYADDAMADRFAFEAAYPTGKPFGFHGLYNFCRVVAQDELATLAPAFSDAIARSIQLGQLLRNCIALGQWTAAAALATRRLAAIPEDAEARKLLARAESALASGPSVGRNDPCPCGSGKRYKQCHGALGAGSPARSSAAEQNPTSIPSSTSALTLAQRGVAAHQRGDIAAAERAYREALRIDPEQPLAQHYLGVVLYQRARFADALPLLQQSAAHVPAEPEFQNNLGLALAALDRNDDAIAAYRATLALKSTNAAAANNLGLALQAQNHIGEAIAAYRQALAISPTFAHAHWNLALALLANDEYAEGWPEYEWRLRLPELGGRASALPSPRWEGQDLQGRSLLLIAEQGAGDAVQFVRFAATIAVKGARIVVQAQDSLRPLLATAPGVAETVPMGAPTQCDFSLPLLSVGTALNVRPGDGAAIPYLRSDAALRASAAAHVDAIRQGRRAIGIAWAGAAHHLNDRRRSIPPSLLAPLFALQDIAWFALQQGPREAAIADVRGADTVTRLPATAQWSDTAALIDALDAVVTVDTSIAHVAGALGKSVHVMLPFAPDWRWGIAASTTPWYPTARLFRQPAIGDWDAVVAALVEALRG